MRPFSRDLRERFGRALGRGLSARAAAELFEVSPATGVRWAQSWRRTGTIEAGKVGGYKRCKLEPEREWLLVRIAEKDVTLQELRAMLREERSVVVSCDTLWRYLKRLGKTFKKRPSSVRSKTVRTLPAAGRAGSLSSVE